MFQGSYSRYTLAFGVQLLPEGCRTRVATVTAGQSSHDCPWVIVCMCMFSCTQSSWQGKGWQPVQLSWASGSGNPKTKLSYALVIMKGASGHRAPSILSAGLPVRMCFWEKFDLWGTIQVKGSIVWAVSQRGIFVQHNKKYLLWWLECFDQYVVQIWLNGVCNKRVWWILTLWYLDISDYINSVCCSH